MAIRILIRLWTVALCFLFTGCEKWADGVVSEIEFPEHTPSLAASSILITGDMKAVLSITNTASLLSTDDVVLPVGASASIRQGGEVVLVWSPSDTGFVDGQKMLVLELDEALDLPLGPLELTVNAPEWDELKATASQPPLPELDWSFQAGADTLASEWGKLVYDVVTLDLLNRAGERDFFALRLEEGFVFEQDTFWSPAWGGEFEDPRLDFNWVCACWLLDDQNIDGQSLSDVEINYERWNDDPYGEYGEAALRLSVDLMDPSLGEFYKSVQSHEDAQDNPFANPSGIRSNTSSGFGHFGLASRKRFALE